MDISKWLLGTSLPDDLPVASQPQPLTTSYDRNATTRANESARRQARKRKLSDSSFIDVTRYEERQSSVRSGGGRCAGGSGSFPTDKSGSLDAGSSGQEASSHQFQRRSRRKTRLGRYELKTSGTKGPTRHRKISEGTKKAKRKIKKKKKNADWSGSGAIDSYHAKNVPIDRLTLKPGDNLGFLGRGRASSPMRGRGLPDLVFSEMRFLKRGEKASGSRQLSPIPQPPAREDHSRTKYDNISPHFTARRPPLAEMDVNLQSKPKAACRSQKMSSRQAENVSTSERIFDTIEIEPRENSPSFATHTETCSRSAGSLSWSLSTRSLRNSAIPNCPIKIDVDELESHRAPQTNKAKYQGGVEAQQSIVHHPHAGRHCDSAFQPAQSTQAEAHPDPLRSAENIKEPVSTIYQPPTLPNAQGNPCFQPARPSLQAEQLEDHMSDEFLGSGKDVHNLSKNTTEGKRIRSRRSPDVDRSDLGVKSSTRPCSLSRLLHSCEAALAECDAYRAVPCQLPDPLEPVGPRQEGLHAQCQRHPFACENFSLRHRNTGLVGGMSQPAFGYVQSTQMPSSQDQMTSEDTPACLSLQDYFEDSALIGLLGNDVAIDHATNTQAEQMTEHTFQQLDASSSGNPGNATKLLGEMDIVFKGLSRPHRLY